jgi:hypothetical protein
MLLYVRGALFGCMLRLMVELVPEESPWWAPPSVLLAAALLVLLLFCDSLGSTPPRGKESGGSATGTGGTVRDLGRGVLLGSALRLVVQLYWLSTLPTASLTGGGTAAPVHRAPAATPNGNASGVVGDAAGGGVASGGQPTLTHHGVEDLREVWAIGDLHGDADCGKAWVERTGLVDLTTWRWTGAPDALLVFLGDYVDRGPQSRGVLQLVMNLTRAFPKQVGQSLACACLTCPTQSLRPVSPPGFLPVKQPPTIPNPYPQPVPFGRWWLF